LGTKLVSCPRKKYERPRGLRAPRSVGYVLTDRGRLLEVKPKEVGLYLPPLVLVYSI
jgi:hypothetical protein